MLKRTLWPVPVNTALPSHSVARTAAHTQGVAPAAALAEACCDK